MIEAIHTKVPGRARYKLQGLYRSESLKGFLESRLPQRNEIKRVSANALTGNLLVEFNTGHDHNDIAVLIADVLRESHSGVRKRRRRKRKTDSRQLTLFPVDLFPVEETEETFERKDTLRRILPSAIKQSEWPAKIKETITQILPRPAQQEEKPWHLLGRNAILDLLSTQTDLGLSSDAAKERLIRYGPNTLPEPLSRSPWSIFFNQFLSLPVGLLGAAAGLSVITGGVLDAAVIMGVVVANVVIGYVTESRAERTINSLRSFIRPSALLIRDGRPKELPAGELVPGDVFILKPGTYVAADARVIEASHLSIDESALTGESMPALKIARTLKRKDSPLSERSNMVYMGTLVTGGEGLAVVVATGSFTEMGKLQILLDETTSPETPIQRQLRTMGDQLVFLCAAICGIVFLIGYVRGYGVLQMLRSAISLAGAAVPEGLPAAATINFALGITHMKRHHVLIRHLQAVETLGAVQTVCLDKTGTITWNQMSILEMTAGPGRVSVENGHFRLGRRRIDPLKYEDLRRLIQVCALCNETKINGKGGNGEVVLSGSPTENALVHMAINSGVDVSGLRESHKLIKVNHRAENRLFMSTLHALPDSPGRLFALKGSPPEVFSMCDWQLKDGKRIALTEQDRLEIETENDRMAGEALRVLGVAYSELKPKEKPNLEGGLTWLGLVGMADPIRDGVKELIKVYHRAGIETVMITGDQSPTAYAVANQLDLGQGEPLEILDSTALTDLDPEVMQALAKKVHVYSRVSPAHKLKIVQALQSAGKVVAMTGDGINDGPALKAADMGIAMGRSGTDVAREVADVVLEEDDLESLIIAVRDGRATYNNIKKSVHFFLSTNISEVMVMFAAMAAGLGVPLNVMQLLWINIISDIFPGLALSMEAPEAGVLEQPPRDCQEPLISSKDFKRMAYESAVISGGALAAYGYGLSRYGAGAKAGSLAFQSLTIGQLLHAISCRSEKHSVFERNQLPPNKYFNLAVGGSLALQMLTMIVPSLRRFLGLTPLNLVDAAIVGGTALSSLAVNETTKKTGR